MLVKPIFGSQGKGIQYVDGNTPLPHWDDDSVFYIQRFIAATVYESCYRDWRLFVVNGRTIAAMQRMGTKWLNNVAQGAQCVKAMPRKSLCDLAEQACSAIGIDYAGVDILVDKDGRPWVLEVNSIPAWSGLQSVSRTDIAASLAEGLFERLNNPCA